MDTREVQKIKGQIKGNKQKVTSIKQRKCRARKHSLASPTHTKKNNANKPKKYIMKINIYQSSRNGCSFRQRHKSQRASSPLRYKMCRPITQGGCYYHYKKKILKKNIGFLNFRRFPFFGNCSQGAPSPHFPLSPSLSSLGDLTS